MNRLRRPIFTVLAAMVCMGCASLPGDLPLTYRPSSPVASVAERNLSWQRLRLEILYPSGGGKIAGQRRSARFLADYYRQANAQEAVLLSRQAQHEKGEGVLVRFFMPAVGVIAGGLIGQATGPRNGKAGLYGVFPSEDNTTRVVNGLAGAALGGIAFTLASYAGTIPLFRESTKVREKERLAFNRKLLHDLRLEGLE